MKSLLQIDLPIPLRLLALALIAQFHTACDDPDLPAPDDRFGEFIEAPEEADGVRMREVTEDDHSYLGYNATVPTVDVLFPDPMVSEPDDADLIPVTVAPEARLKAHWLSARHCHVGLADPGMPGTVYTFRIAGGLRDKGGREVEATQVAKSVESAPFGVAYAFQVSRQPGYDLSSRPLVDLRFTHPVSLENLRDHIFIQDRDSREKFPMELLMADASAEEELSVERIDFSAICVDDLPPGRDYDLLVERLREDRTRLPIPHLLVKPIGSTSRPEVAWVSAVHQPLDDPLVRIRLTQRIDVDSVGLETLSVSPPVENLRFFTSSDNIDIRGEFDPAIRYTIGISKELKARTGYGLEKDEKWGATFEPPRPSLVFPSQGVIHETTVSPFAVEFVQTNLVSVNWSLHRIDASRYLEWKERGAGRESQEGDGSPDPAVVAQFDRFLSTSSPIAEGEVGAAVGEGSRRVEVPGGISVDSGFFVFCADGKAPDGRRSFNYALVTRSALLGLKRSQKGNETVLTAVDATTNDPVSGVEITALAKPEDVVGGGPRVTGPGGTAILTASQAAVPLLLKQEDRIGVIPQTWDAFDRWNPPEQIVAATIDGAPRLEGSRSSKSQVFTDRSIYAPGESVSFAGIVRIANEEGGWDLPEPRESVNWALQSLDYRVKYNTGFENPLSDFGISHGSFRLPEDIAPGVYSIGFADDGMSLYDSANIVVRNYEPHPFTVEVDAPATSFGTSAGAAVESRLFHGAANAGAKVEWEARWIVSNLFDLDPYFEGSVLSESKVEYLEVDRDIEPPVETDETVFTSYLPASRGWKGSPFVITDRFSLHAQHRGLTDGGKAAVRVRNGSEVGALPVPELTEKIRGEAVLDDEGRIELTCENPFLDRFSCARFLCAWKVRVVSAEGRVRESQKLTRLQRAELIPALRLVRADREKVALEVRSCNARDRLRSGLTVQAQLHRADICSVREELGSGIARYRNSAVFEPVWSGELTTPTDKVVDLPGPGRYVAVISAEEGSRVSDSILMEGDDSVGTEIRNPETVVCEPERTFYRIGEEVAIQLEAPFEDGTAEVSIETDEVIDTMRFPLSGTIHRIAFEAKRDYAPASTVAIHISRPPSADRPPAECFSTVPIRFVDDRREIGLDIGLSSSEWIPGGDAVVTVTASDGEGVVAGAGVTLFAVDEAVLQVEPWKQPDPFDVFFFRHDHQVETKPLYLHLPLSLPPSASQKGFLVGGGFLEEADAILSRKLKEPLVFWRSDLVTDENGSIEHEFRLPDRISSYRVSAVAYQGSDHFGSGHDFFQIDKPLWIDPLVPQFTRAGDEFRVRTRVRCGGDAEQQVRLRCEGSEGGYEISGSADAQLTARPGGDNLATFEVRTPPSPMGDSLSFELVSGDRVVDRLEVRVPILPAAMPIRLLEQTSVESSDAVPGSSLVPDGSSPGFGDAGVYFASTPVLPLLISARDAFDPAHPATDELALRTLAALHVLDLLDTIPSVSGSEEAVDSFENRIREATMRIDSRRRYGSSPSETGYSIWSDESATDVRTGVLAAWALIEASRRGLGASDDHYGQFGFLVSVLDNEFGYGSDYFTRLLAAAAVAPSVRDHMSGSGVSIIPEELVDGLASALGGLDQFTDRFDRVASALYLYGSARAGAVGAEALSGPLSDLDNQSPLVPDPGSLATAERDELVLLAARAAIRGPVASPGELDEFRASLDQLASRCLDYSAEESLWAVLALHHLAENAAVVAPLPRQFGPGADPKPVFGESRRSAGWPELPFSTLATLSFPSPGRGFLVADKRFVPSAEAPPVADRSLRLERRILKMPGAESGHAVRLGDDVLLEYRIESDYDQDRLLLVDAMPAGLEPLVHSTERLGILFDSELLEKNELLEARHATLDPQEIRLHFERVPSGPSVVYLHARAVRGGEFAWPSARLASVPDPRTIATVASDRVEVLPPPVDP